MDFMEYLSQLEQEFSDKKGLFKKIDAEKCRGIIAQMRLAYPEAMREAAYIIENKQKIIASAETVAKKTLNEAETKAEQLVGESEIVRSAENEANSVLGEAYEQRSRLLMMTHEHLSNVFLDMEDFMGNTVRMIQANRLELDKALGLTEEKKE